MILIRIRFDAMYRIEKTPDDRVFAVEFSNSKTRGDLRLAAASSSGEHRIFIQNQTEKHVKKRKKPGSSWSPAFRHSFNAVETLRVSTSSSGFSASSSDGQIVRHVLTDDDAYATTELRSAKASEDEQVYALEHVENGDALLFGSDDSVKRLDVSLAKETISHTFLPQGKHVMGGEARNPSKKPFVFNSTVGARNAFWVAALSDGTARVLSTTALEEQGCVGERLHETHVTGVSGHPSNVNVFASIDSDGAFFVLCGRRTANCPFSHLEATQELTTYAQESVVCGMSDA